MHKVVLTCGLWFDKRTLQWITLEATRYDENNLPSCWAIRTSGGCLSKFTGEFNYEPFPSSRDDEFFKEYRFDSVEEAEECFKKFKDKICLK